MQQIYRRVSVQISQFIEAFLFPLHKAPLPSHENFFQLKSPHLGIEEMVYIMQVQLLKIFLHVFVAVCLIRNCTLFLTLCERLAKQSTTVKEYEILFDMILVQAQKQVYQPGYLQFAKIFCMWWIKAFPCSDIFH